MAKKKDDIDIVIKPIGKLGGLDRIHVALIALVLIMVALLLIISYSKPSIINTNSPNTTKNTTSMKACAYSFINGTCAYPMHNESQVRQQVGQILASYANVQGELSLVPYFSNIANTTVSYIPASGTWYAVVPEINPTNSSDRFYETFSIYDKNLSIEFASIQTVQPSEIGKNSVVAQGVVGLSGRFACQSGNESSVPVYMFMDPYATGAVESLQDTIALQNKFQSNVNVSLELLFGPASQAIANQQGAANTEQLERYLLCGSQQANFSRFASNMQSAFSGQYMSQQVLSGIANYSRLNNTQLNLCINSANTTSLLNRQALLADFYNITATPIAVVNCKYMAIPATLENATCYDDPGLCSST